MAFGGNPGLQRSGAEHFGSAMGIETLGPGGLGPG